MASKIELTEQEVSFNLENTKSIRVENNALTFGNTVYQISNISQVTVRKMKRTRRDIMPSVLLLLWLFCGTLIATSSQEPRAKLLAFFVAVVGFFFYFDSRMKSSSYVYYLVVELNSGNTRYFKDESHDFLEKVARRLHAVIQNPGYAASFIVNFSSNQIIEIYNDLSNHIGGDVLNSIVNSGTANDVHNRQSVK